MQWTKEKPSSPGWYWHRFRAYLPEIVQVRDVGDEDLEFGDAAEPRTVRDRFSDEDLWAGPIPTPDGELS